MFLLHNPSFLPSALVSRWRLDAVATPAVGTPLALVSRWPRFKSSIEAANQVFKTLSASGYRPCEPLGKFTTTKENTFAAFFRAFFAKALVTQVECQRRKALIASECLAAVAVCGQSCSARLQHNLSLLLTPAMRTQILQRRRRRPRAS